MKGIESQDNDAPKSKNHAIASFRRESKHSRLLTRVVSKPVSKGARYRATTPGWITDFTTNRMCARRDSWDLDAYDSVAGHPVGSDR